ncbi:TPA: hypothetical protein ACH3X2_002504 [Trebouxia sp. C0005]
MAGMMVFCYMGMFVPKQVSVLQVSKICIMPTLIAIELIFYGKHPSHKTMLAVILVCLATVTGQGLATSLLGLSVGLSAVLVTAVYQVWASRKQKELQTGSMQLLHQYMPLAAVMLAVLVPIVEPVGLFENQANPHTLMGYTLSVPSIVAIAISSALGLLVNLSTFLVIGATSSLI